MISHVAVWWLRMDSWLGYIYIYKKSVCDRDRNKNELLFLFLYRRCLFTAQSRCLQNTPKPTKTIELGFFVWCTNTSLCGFVRNWSAGAWTPAVALPCYWKCLEFSKHRMLGGSTSSMSPTWSLLQEHLVTSNECAPELLLLWSVRTGSPPGVMCYMPQFVGVSLCNCSCTTWKVGGLWAGL